MVESSFGGTLLRFRALGIPVRVEAGFLVTTLVLGAGRLRSAVEFGGWLAVVFVSVFVHELGHALAGRRYGYAPDIRLYAWGGVTTWTASVDPGPWRRLVISLAGPFVGMLLGLACWVIKPHVHAAWLRHVLQDCVYASGVWGAINLVPILPLDGGQAFQAVLGMITPKHEELGARLVSAIAGITAGAVALHFGLKLVAVLAAWMGVASARQILEARRAAQDEALIARMTPVFAAAIDAGDGSALVAAAESVKAEARTARARTWIAENIAVGKAMNGDVAGAVHALTEAPIEQPPSTQIEGFVVRIAITARKHALAEATGADVEMMLLSTSPGGNESPWVSAATMLRTDGSVAVDAIGFARVREAAEILRRHGDAARLGEALLARAPDPDLAFAVACAWAGAGEERMAAERALQAVALGFRNWERLDAAPEIAQRAFARARQKI